MRIRLLPAAAVLSAFLLLAGCTSSTDTAPTGGAMPQPTAEDPTPTADETTSPADGVEPAIDLTGEWKQTNSNSGDSYQVATISEDEIVVNWVNDEESTTALYWAGSFEAPTEATEPFAWDSVNDTTQTESALLASADPTKTFTYENGVISYTVTGMGVTATVELAKQ